MLDKPNPVALLRIMEERDRLRDELKRERMRSAKYKHLAEKATRTADAKPAQEEQHAC